MPNQNVEVNCRHCGETTHAVSDHQGIPGVPDTYVKAGEQAHADSVDHAVNVMKKDSIDEGLRKMGMTVSGTTPSIVGRISEFGHGKDHNA
jgi:hypothetical protein